MLLNKIDKSCGFDFCVNNLNEEITIIFIYNFNDFHWH